MRVLTVRQPWAWAIIHAGKDVENRVQTLGPYRGPVAIHAGLGEVDRNNDASRALRAAHGTEAPTQLHFGAVIGVVDLTDVHHDNTVRGASLHCCSDSDWHGRDPRCPGMCSPWAMADHHHLVLANPRPLARPIPHRGGLGLRRAPADLVAAITEQLGAVA
ncbi:hypothetical protein CHO01_25440 [Cellulomonas hominis]|uniref:ASCH domain-containing protein n=1 Tax=Cellulomonas hominis TaxID=156981 RepID=A0A511FHY4_9CELL|nr:hypothetical protein [Cellulomonas hominis]MBB5472511.1 hypothetical protein [Cellulomonas hominis]NKY05881.1 hypothetical protein [Cellulomonas hominis]GEL47428.1 hypothetical protein CHO01_25440 [Cellulomonas hominis]